MSADDRSTRSSVSADLDRAPGEELRAYVKAKQHVAQLLRDLEAFTQQDAPWAAERAHRLMVRLGEDRFQLVVVGQFKRGKSSLMNALIGRPLLPTGAIPVTSAVTSLRYGSTLRAIVSRADQLFPLEVPVSELPAYITEAGNPDNQKRVMTAEIEVPAAFLRRGLHFIDTPGIGSAHEHNTATTLAFLPEADAAIFVTAADGALSDTELQFLDAVRQHVRKLFIVLNKIDLLGADERAEAVAYTTHVLGSRLGVEDVRIFPLSAAWALGTQRHHETRRQASGLPELEAALASFLSEERQATFLVALLDRAVAVLDEIGFLLSVRARGTGTGSGLPEDVRAEIERRFRALDRKRRATLDRAAAVVSEWQTTVLDPALAQFQASTRSGLSTELPGVLRGLRTRREARLVEAEDWMRTQLQQRGLAWLRAFAPQIDDLVRLIAQDLESTVRGLLDQPARIAAEVLGVPGAAGTNRDELPQQEDYVVSFEPPVVLPSTAIDNALLVPRLMTAFGTRRLLTRLPASLDATVGAMRETVLSHLRSALDALEQSSARDLAQEQRRIGEVLAVDRSAGEAQRDGRDSLDTCQMLAGRAVALREALLRHEDPPSFTDDAFSTPPAQRESGTIVPAPAVRETVTGTCFICAVASHAVHDFFCSYQYAISQHGSAAQRELAASRGLCPVHTWQLERISSPRGICLAYPLVLDQAETSLRGLANLPAVTIRERLRDLVGHGGTCPACRVRRESERSAAGRAVQALRTPGARGLDDRQWLCLRHLALVVNGLDDRTASGVVRRHVRHVADVADAMREFVIKQDARRRDLLTREQTRAYREALVALAGERYLAASDEEDQ